MRRKSKKTHYNNSSSIDKTRLKQNIFRNANNIHEGHWNKATPLFFFLLLVQSPSRKRDRDTHWWLVGGGSMGADLSFVIVRLSLTWRIIETIFPGRESCSFSSSSSWFWSDRGCGGGICWLCCPEMEPPSPWDSDDEDVKVWFWLWFCWW